ncbi:MAG: hypothetical protein PUB12_06765 [[Clostridium] aminophilum]|uniref:hypothetical protein n=1 Tax=[Clostridium] aminophilum TaxID=1526 RepID=UPI0026EE9236|nr:hypothetical protein [[Clostridium] aminophilum]MDD6196572.1 hypothetical protein [[Clostridium] aminophilum]
MKGEKEMGIEVYMPARRTIPDPVEIEMNRYRNQYQEEREKRLKAEAEACVMTKLYGLMTALVILLTVLLMIFR